MDSEEFNLPTQKKKNKLVKIILIILGIIAFLMLLGGFIFNFIIWPQMKKSIKEKQLEAMKDQYSSDYPSSSSSIDRYSSSSHDKYSSSSSKDDYYFTDPDNYPEISISEEEIKPLEIAKYYLEVNVLSNGDLLVKELKTIAGKTDIIHSSINLGYVYGQRFRGYDEHFIDSYIYSGRAIEDVKIYGVNYTIPNFNLINSEDLKEFEELTFARPGDYGIYVKKPQYFEYKIYQPSHYQQASLITYKIKDAVVVHNDVAEINYPFIKPSYPTKIGEVIIKVNLPNDSRYLNGYSNLNVVKSSQRQIQINGFNLGVESEVRGRVVFDKSLVYQVTKFSNVDAKDKIIEVEEKLKEENK
ncbi:MAG: DUF2207 domain-containing protein [Mollicutes bacterium]|nr:DUF2207 domain-containing protein [Mollicutes bacterium]